MTLHSHICQEKLFIFIPHYIFIKNIITPNKNFLEIFNLSKDPACLQYSLIFHRYGKLLFPTHSRPSPGILLPLVWTVSLLLVTDFHDKCNVIINVANQGSALHFSHQTRLPGSWRRGGACLCWWSDVSVSGLLLLIDILYFVKII